MFSLIVSVIAIILVIALAIASIYYGSGAYKEKQATIAAQTLTNQAQQLYGAAVLYSQDNAGSWPALNQVLLDQHYINNIPQPPASSLLIPHPQLCLMPHLPLVPLNITLIPKPMPSHSLMS